ncbi:choline transport protein [Ceratobasidium sp. AG-Ba]|nr:choline transport protein [Ceratobasidium sp. AG-Ba]
MSTREEILEALQSFNDKFSEGNTPEFGGAATPIRWLVVWDTVGAVISGANNPIISTPDSELPGNIVNCLHSLAFHENRKAFKPILFEPNGVTNLNEVWFTGAHSDVGGGVTSNLPNASLLWVLGKVPELSALSTHTISYPELTTMAPSTVFELMGLPRSDMPVLGRVYDKAEDLGCETRIESGLLGPNSFIHESEIIRLQANTSDGLASMRELYAAGWDQDHFMVRLTASEESKLSEASANLRPAATRGQDRKRAASH